MNPEETIQKIKEKAQEFAKNHATQNAKAFYVLGKKDAASAILLKIKQDGISAIKDLAKEMLEIEPTHETAKWILENEIN